MKNDVRVWLILVLLVGLPTSVCALDIGAGFAGVFKFIAVAFKTVLGLIMAIALIRKLVKKN
ncbi:MAG: hypothetical protein EOO60_01005 [Hymenobacter sp.]|nr:MAG: hypothetical protein EOO60_01005 [Hymenobacter sp.]